MSYPKLLEALNAIQDLTDEDHKLLQTWFSSGQRQYLRASGITDEDMGPLRPEYDYPEADGIILATQGSMAPHPLLLRAVHAIRELDSTESEAVANWFKFAGREWLQGLGASQADIGDWRIIIDEIESEDDRYDAAIRANERAESLPRDSPRGKQQSYRTPFSSQGSRRK